MWLTIPTFPDANGPIKVPPLPKYIRLRPTDLLAKARLNLPGEWYHLPLPNDLEELNSPKFGAEWLTQAFQASGRLPLDNAVVAIESFNEMELQGLDAQGGAGEKAIMAVKYAKPDPSLHTTLFVKCPWNAEKFAYHRNLISVQVTH